jgi:hypothetical protein
METVTWHAEAAPGFSVSAADEADGESDSRSSSPDSISREAADIAQLLRETEVMDRDPLSLLPNFADAIAADDDESDFESSDSDDVQQFTALGLFSSQTGGNLPALGL